MTAWEQFIPTRDRFYSPTPSSHLKCALTAVQSSSVSWNNDQLQGMNTELACTVCVYVRYVRTYVCSRASCTAWSPSLCCSLQDHLFKQIAHSQAMSHTHPHTRHSHTHTFPCTVYVHVHYSMYMYITVCMTNIQ